MLQGVARKMDVSLPTLSLVRGDMRWHKMAERVMCARRGGGRVWVLRGGRCGCSVFEYVCQASA